MEIKITKQHTQSVHIPVPCFFKSTFRYIGVIDEKTLITFVDYGHTSEIASYEIGKSGQVWLEATQEEMFNLTTEEDFFEAYDKALKSITITPIFKTW